MYMAAQRYDISHRALKNISRVSAVKYFSTREEEFLISK